MASQWWADFEDPNLNDWIQLGLSDNYTLQAARHRLTQFQELAIKAGASAWPSVDASFNANRDLSNGSESPSTTRVSVAASYEIDWWGKLRHERLAAGSDLKQEASSLEVARISLCASIAATWYQLAVQHQLADILAQQIDVNGQILELIDLRFRKGQTSAADVLRQKQLVETRLGQLSLVQSQVRLLEHQLCVLAGKPPRSNLFSDAISIPQLTSLPTTDVPGEILLRRPDVRASWSSFQAADQRAAAAFVAQFPRLSLSANTSGSGSSLSDAFSFDMKELALNLLAPIWSGRSLKAEARRSGALAQQRYAEFNQVTLEALRDVEDALTSEYYQSQFIASLIQQNQLARVAYERIKDQYSHGSIDYLNVLSSLLSWQDLERSLVSARGLQVQHRISLYRALAGPIDRDTHTEDESP